MDHRRRPERRGTAMARRPSVHVWPRRRGPSGERVSAQPITLGLEAPPRYGITRQWAMPSAETFSIPPIAEFIQRWWRSPSVDPFARNTGLATVTNDLSPDTSARYHMDAAAFCD